MADKDFVVKNGLVVNSTFTANSTLVNAPTINTPTVNVSTQVIVGNSTVNAVINSTSWFTLSNSTVSYSYTLPTSAQKSATNYFLNANGSWTIVSSSSGGAYYKGNLGTVGDSADRGNLYRINGNTQTANVTIAAGENTVAAGPVTIDTGYNLTIETGGRVVIV